MSSSVQDRGATPTNYMKKGTAHTTGEVAQTNNIQAAKVVAGLLKTSLGPRGLDKMLVDSVGQVTVTNDGATILGQLDIQHPAAKILVEISKTTDLEVGDGTTSSVVLTGALLSNAERLITQNVHPTIIVDGYKKAEDKVKELLKEMSENVEKEGVTDPEVLKKIAITSMQTKLVRGDAEHLADMVISACQAVLDKGKVDLNNIKVEKRYGVPIKSSRMVNGIVLEKEIVHSGMPEKVPNARILLLNSPIEVGKTETTGHVTMDDPAKLKQFLKAEESMLEEIVDNIQRTGANVVVCQKGIDDRAQDFLATAGITAIRRVSEADLTKLMKATGGRIVTNIASVSEKDLGTAELVEQRLIEPDKWVFIEGCKSTKAITILLGAASGRVVDEVERSIHDALMVVKDVLESPYVIAGGGAPEAYLSSKLKDFANTFEGREQLAIKQYAEALEVIPLALAENAGMDPIDTMTELRSKQNQGQKWIGVNGIDAKVDDMYKLNVIEPLSVKHNVISNASEATYMILRIDDVLAIPGAPVNAKPEDPYS